MWTRRAMEVTITVFALAAAAILCWLMVVSSVLLMEGDDMPQGRVKAGYRRAASHGARRISYGLFSTLHHVDGRRAPILQIRGSKPRGLFGRKSR